MGNAWLVRAYPHNTNINRIEEFRSGNFVAIGWYELGSLKGCSGEEIRRRLTEQPYEMSGLALGNAYATVNLFVNRMQVGDLVLVPNGDDIHFAEITGEYRWENSYANGQTGFPHCRTVKWLSTVSRGDLSKRLRSSLKVHRTTADLSQHYDEIDALAHGKSYQPTRTEPQVLEVSYPLRRNFSVSFQIPADMTRDEARRLMQYVETLYFEP